MVDGNVTGIGEELETADVTENICPGCGRVTRRVTGKLCATCLPAPVVSQRSRLTA